MWRKVPLASESNCDHDYYDYDYYGYCGYHDYHYCHYYDSKCLLVWFQIPLPASHGVCSCLVPCLHPSYSSVNADLGWVQKSPSDIIHKPCMYAFRRPSNTVCVVLSEIDQLQHTGSAHAWLLVPSIVFDCERQSRLSPKIPRDVVYKPCMYAFRRPSDTVCVVPSEIDQLQHTGLYCLMLLAPLNAHDRPGTSSFWSGFTMSFLWRQFFHMSLLDGTA